MRQFLRPLSLLCLVLALLPAAVALPAAAHTELVPDDELVVINRDDRIVVTDPYTPAGYVPLSWESPQTGFRQVYTGDFNGDGTDEIVGLRGGEAHIFDPYRQSNEADVARIFTAAPGQVWQLAAIGRFLGGVRDGLVLVESLDAGSVRARMIVYVFDPVSGWAQNYSLDLGATFQALATGDVDGNGGDELTGIRSGTGYNQILIFDPSANWATMYEGNYSYPWVAIAVGNVQTAAENKDEIVTTRTGVVTNLPSYLIFRYLSSTTLQDVGTAYFNPSFLQIALADVTGNGDDEVYLLRPGVHEGTPIVALISRNYGSDPVIEFNELAGQTRFGAIHAGDLEGDSKDEIIVMADDEYIIYTEPANSRAFQSYPGAYSTSLSFVAADLDGPGIPPGPRLVVTPTTVNFTLQPGQTGTQTVQITNGGTDTLVWTSTVTQGPSWLSIQPTGGTAPTATTLQIDASYLTAGAYTGTVRISGQSGSFNSPQDVTVRLTVNTQPFAVTPAVVSWLYVPPDIPGLRIVTVTGTYGSWHAGAVSMDNIQRIEAAIAAGRSMTFNNGFLVVGDGGDDVPVVDYIDVSPSFSSANPTYVTLSLTSSNVAYGLSEAAVVFAADGFASPTAVVVRASVLRTQPGATDLLFLPRIVAR